MGDESEVPAVRFAYAPFEVGPVAGRADVCEARLFLGENAEVTTQAVRTLANSATFSFGFESWHVLVKLCFSTSSQASQPNLAD